MIWMPRHGFSTKRSLSLPTIIGAFAASANSKYLSSSGSLQSATRIVGSKIRADARRASSTRALASVDQLVEFLPVQDLDNLRLHSQRECDPVKPFGA